MIPPRGNASEALATRQNSTATASDKEIAVAEYLRAWGTKFEEMDTGNPREEEHVNMKA